MTQNPLNPDKAFADAVNALEDAATKAARRRGTGSGSTITGPTEVVKVSVTAPVDVVGTKGSQAWFRARLIPGADVVLTQPTGTTWAPTGVVTVVPYP